MISFHITMKTITWFIFLSTLVAISIANSPDRDPQNITDNAQVNVRSDDANTKSDDRNPIAGKGKRIGNGRHAFQKKGARQANKNEPVTPKPCHTDNFQALNECCQEQIGSLFSFEVRNKCYLTQGQFGTREVLYSYVINRYMNETTKKLNLLLQNGKKDGKLEDMKCLLSCIFKAENLFTITDNDAIILDTDRLKTYFKTNDGKPESQTLLNEAVLKCTLVAPESKYEIQLTDLAVNQQLPDSCNVMPFVFTQCVRGELIATCKLPSIPTEVTSKPRVGSYRYYADFCQSRRKALEPCRLS